MGSYMSAVPAIDRLRFEFFPTGKNVDLSKYKLVRLGGSPALLAWSPTDPCTVYTTCYVGAKVAYVSGDDERRTRIIRALVRVGAIRRIDAERDIMLGKLKTAALKILADRDDVLRLLKRNGLDAPSLCRSLRARFQALTRSHAKRSAEIVADVKRDERARAKRHDGTTPPPR